MSLEERVSQLEADVKSLREAIGGMARVTQVIGGQSRMYDGAVLALIVSHPRPDLLEPVLREHLARIDAGIVGQSQSDEHLAGAQQAQDLLELALAAALERFGRGEG